MSRRRRRRRKQARAESKSWYQPDLRFVLLISLPISLLAGILLGYKGDAWISLPVCYVWMTGIFLAYCLNLLAASRFVLPPNAGHETEDTAATPTGYPATREGARLISFQATRRLMPNPIRGRLGFVLREPPATVPESFGIYGAGIVPSHLAFALGRGLGFTRAAGPGYVRLNSYEHVLKTIDLRLQYRQQPAEAVTRDGIPLTTSVSTLFHIRRPQNGAMIQSDRFPYQYTPETIFRLLYGNSVDAESEVIWSERLCSLISAALVSEVSQFSVDQLYQPPGGQLHDNDTVPIVQIRDEIASQFQKELHTTFEFDREAENPLYVLSAEFSELEPPQEVRAQRIESWRAEWKQRQRQHEAEAEKEEMLTRQAARARAELELIQNLTEMIRTIHLATGADLSEVIMMRLSESLDQMAGETGNTMPLTTQVAPDQPATSASDAGNMTAAIQELSRQLRQFTAEDDAAESA